MKKFDPKVFRLGYVALVGVGLPAVLVWDAEKA